MLFYNCQKFSFRDSSLSILVSDKWIKRCWWLWNVNIDISFNYSYTDLITRPWRYFDFVIPHSFLSNDHFLVLNIMLEINLVSNPRQQTWHLFLNLLISFFLLYSACPFSHPILYCRCSGTIRLSCRTASEGKWTLDWSMEQVDGDVIALAPQAFRLKRVETSICMEVTFNCRLLGLSLLASAVLACMLRSR